MGEEDPPFRGREGELVREWRGRTPPPIVPPPWLERGRTPPPIIVPPEPKPRPTVPPVVPPAPPRPAPKDT